MPRDQWVPGSCLGVKRPGAESWLFTSIYSRG